MTQAGVPPRAFLLIFFTGVILAGTVLLLLPVSWAGADRLAPIDALFIATSAVCVTGLVTVDVADFTRFGQSVIVLLVQTGGLGIITFSTMFLMLPGRRRMSFRTRHFVQAYTLPVVEHDPFRMSFYIVTFTVAVELAGVLALYPYFRGRVDDPLFTSVFHAVSAFCNAGFSTFRTNFEEHRGSAHLLLTISGLIVCGGLGFVVFVDIVKRAVGWKNALTFHTRVVVLSTAVLIAIGAVLFYAFEASNTMAGLGVGQRLANALFQSVTPRTAGFNALRQGDLAQPSQVLTMLLMLIGGSPASAAGGIKTSTAFLVLLQLVARRDRHGGIGVFDRKVDSSSLSDALLFAVRALCLLFICVFVLLVSESRRGVGIIALAFESVSAFATVGLSLGVTAGLSGAGKMVIIATMFIGRVGLISLASRDRRPRVTRAVDYPLGEVLIG